MPHIPTFHMHIGKSERAFYISLWPHSEVLGFLPEPSSPNEDLAPGARPYVLASDTSVLPGPRLGRGQGALSEGGLQIMVPGAHIMLEAYMRLGTAYLHQDRGLFYISMIGYVGEYIDADGMLDDTLLPKPCRIFWENWNKGRMSICRLCAQFEANAKLEGLEDQDQPGTQLCT